MSVCDGPFCAVRHGIRFGHGPKGVQGGEVLRASERREVADDVREVVESGAGVVVEVAPHPAGSGAAVAAGILVGDQGDELERLVEADLSDLACRRLRDEQVAALDRSLKDGPRMSLCCRACLSGAGGQAILKAPGRARGYAVSRTRLELGKGR